MPDAACSDRILPNPASTRYRHRQQAAYLFQILRGIHFERFVPRLDRFDANAVLERTELFERLRPFERRRLERREHQKRITPIPVQPDMSIEWRPAAAWVSHIRDRRSREIQRVAAAIDHDLDDVGVGQ